MGERICSMSLYIHLLCFIRRFGSVCVTLHAEMTKNAMDVLVYSHTSAGGDGDRYIVNIKKFVRRCVKNATRCAL